MSATVYEFPPGTQVMVPVPDEPDPWWSPFGRYRGLHGTVLSLGGRMADRHGPDRLHRVQLEGVEKVCILGSRDLDALSYPEHEMKGETCPACGIGSHSPTATQWYCRCCGTSLTRSIRIERS